MKIRSSFIHPVVPNLYECICSAELKGRYSEECGKQSSSGAPLTLKIFFFQWKSMVAQNSLVTNRRSAMGFLMTTEGQDLGLTFHPKDSFVIKNTNSPAFESSPHHSSRTLTERISLLRTQRRISQQRWVRRVGSSISVRETGKLRSTPGTSWESVGDGEDLPHGHLLGRPGRAFQIPDALMGPRGVAGGPYQPGSEFKWLSFQGGVSYEARSSPGAHRVRSRARSVP